MQLSSDITVLSSHELAELYRGLKSRRLSLKSLGKRALDMPVVGQTRVRVIHPATLWSDDALVIAHQHLGARYPENAQVRSELSTTLIGGIHVFIGEDLYDLTFDSMVRPLTLT